MKLQRKGWTVRWAYLCEDVPDSTSLCPLVWRTVLLTPFKCLCFLLIALALSDFIYKQWRVLIVLLPVVGGLVLVVYGLCRLNVALRRRGASVPTSERSLPYQMYRATKDRVCPFVEIVP